MVLCNRKLLALGRSRQLPVRWRERLSSVSTPHYQRRMSVFLRSQGCRYVFGDAHYLPPLVIEAKHSVSSRGHSAIYSEGCGFVAQRRMFDINCLRNKQGLVVSRCQSSGFVVLDQRSFTPPIFAASHFQSQHRIEVVLVRHSLRASCVVPCEGRGNILSVPTHTPRNLLECLF